MPTTEEVGQYGELVAASWLRRQGCRVLRHNFQWGESGEIDLVCRDGDTLVFAEVKSNASLQHGAPGRAVNAAKRERQRSGARSWLNLLGYEVPIRFDIVEVRLPAGERPQVSRQVGAFSMYEGREWAARHAE